MYTVQEFGSMSTRSNAMLPENYLQALCQAQSEGASHYATQNETANGSGE